MRGWLKHLCNRLIDKLARWVWEGLCRLELDLRETGKQLSLVRLQVGKTEGAFSDLRWVEFRGEQLAQFQTSEGNSRIQEALYRTQAGALLVHIKALEKTAGFPTTHSLDVIEEADLAEGGLYEGLGSSWKGLSLWEFLAQE